MEAIKSIKITNPLWLPMLSPRIKDLADRLKSPAIRYEGLFTYFQQAVQFGSQVREFVTVFSGDSPIGFAHWYVAPLPHVGMVICDFTHMWASHKTAANTIMEEYKKFGQRNNCPFYKFQALDERRFRFFDALCKKHGIDLTLQDYVCGLGRVK
jgi:hypothetical protein